MRWFPSYNDSYPHSLIIGVFWLILDSVEIFVMYANWISATFWVPNMLNVCIFVDFEWIQHNSIVKLTTSSIPDFRLIQEKNILSLRDVYLKN